MTATIPSLAALNAGDLMTENLVLLTENMPLREAAQVLFRRQVGGAPVVNSVGECVGFLSAFDFLRLAERRVDALKTLPAPLPITCSFIVKHRMPDGTEVAECTLAPGVCPIQRKQKTPQGDEMIVCNLPHCVLTDWQVVEVEKLPTAAVSQFMTADPVTAVPTTPIRILARRMIDAHIHHIIVVDANQRPIGIVSSTDVLAAVAYADGER